jgi:hypothetical protein
VIAITAKLVLRLRQREVIMKTVKVKTSELTGAALDWAVAEAEGLMPSKNWTGMYYRPSTDWSVGGPLIERYEITVDPSRSGHWAAANESGNWVESNSPLISTCRAIVASKLGDTVEVPEQLVEVES